MRAAADRSPLSRGSSSPASRGRRRPRPSLDAIPRSREGGDPTVREFLPWHVVEKKLAARAIGAEIDEEPSPPSGVRMSDHGPAAEDADDEDEVAPLTYRVYTLADLEARQGETNLRLSRVAFEAAAVKAPSPWRRVGAALLELVLATKQWAATKGARPDPRAALRDPFEAFGDELEAALRAVAWRKVLTVGSLGLGVSMTLLFVVLTAADLTDDLKPARGRAALAANESGSLLAQFPTTPALEPASPVSAPAAEAELAPVDESPAMIELPDEPQPTPSWNRPPRARKVPAPRPKSKLTFRNADEIFKP